MMLRRIFGPKKEEVTSDWRNFMRRSFIICTRHQIVLVKSNQEG
jgi:hypothetical protein